MRERVPQGRHTDIRERNTYDDDDEGSASVVMFKFSDFALVSVNLFLQTLNLFLVMVDLFLVMFPQGCQLLHLLLPVNQHRVIIKAPLHNTVLKRHFQTFTHNPLLIYLPHLNTL